MLRHETRSSNFYHSDSPSVHKQCKGPHYPQLARYTGFIVSTIITTRKYIYIFSNLRHLRQAFMTRLTRRNEVHAKSKLYILCLLSYITATHSALVTSPLISHPLITHIEPLPEGEKSSESRLLFYNDRERRASHRAHNRLHLSYEARGMAN